MLIDAPITPPLTQGELERLRLDLRKNVPKSGFGAHIRRRMGQSLEFREYRDYHFGEDIRKVDWLASLRKGRSWDRVVRTFDAEESMTLAVVVDARPAMYLPDRAWKITVGCWIMQCLVQAVVAEKDTVILATVFHRRDARPLVVSGRRALAEAHLLAEELMTLPGDEEAWRSEPRCRTDALIAKLNPTSAVALISDCCFDDPSGDIRRLAKASQRGFRQFSVIELDSWPMERARLNGRPLRLGVIEGISHGEDLVETPEDILRQTGRAIEEHHNKLRAMWSGPGLVWPAEPLRWPAREELDRGDLAGFFKATFPAASFLPSLLTRVA